MAVAGVVAALCPPSPRAPSPFSRLRHLELSWVGDAALLERLLPSPSAFPLLEELGLQFSLGYGREPSVADRTALLPLSRPPRLRRLRQSCHLTADAFSFLSSLPLAVLDLSGCLMEFPAQPTSPTPPRTTAVATTWEELALPNSFRRPAGAFVDACYNALAGYADSVAAAAHSDAASLPRLRWLSGGWDASARCLQTVARIPSLTDLVASMGLSAAPDLSPLFTACLQPRLPSLRKFEFPLTSFPDVLSVEATAVLVDSSIAFLTAYASQLQELDLFIYARGSATTALERVLHCSQLRHLVVHCEGREHRRSEADRVDVQLLDPAVASLQPLRLLTYLRLNELAFSVQAMTQLLSICPAVQELVVEEPQPALPDLLELAGGRTVAIMKF